MILSEILPTRQGKVVHACATVADGRNGIISLLGLGKTCSPSPPATVRLTITFKNEVSITRPLAIPHLLVMILITSCCLHIFMKLKRVLALQGHGYHLVFEIYKGFIMSKPVGPKNDKEIYWVSSR